MLHIAYDYNESPTTNIYFREYDALFVFMEQTNRLESEFDEFGQESRRKFGISLKVTMCEDRDENSNEPYHAVQVRAHYVFACSPTGKNVTVELRRARVAWAGIMTRTAGPIRRSQIAEAAL